MRARWLTAALVTVLAGCGTTPAHPAAARPDVSMPAVAPTSAAVGVPTPPTTQGCRTDGIALSIGEVDAAMGLRSVTVTLRNCGTAVYRVNGYPAVEVLDADLKVLDVAVLQGTSNVATIDRYDAPPSRLDLPPGGTAVAVLVWRNLTTDAATVAKGAYVNVAPAAGSSKQTLALFTDPGNTGKLAVSPWTAG